MFHKSFARKIFKRLSASVLSINDDISRRDRYVEFLNIKTSGKVAEHGYVDEYGDLKAALKYANEINSPSFGPNSNGEGESYFLYEEQKKVLSDTIERNKVERVFNFGIYFAHIDSILARKYPDVEFLGTDLSPYNRAFNESKFSDIKNLTILSDDVFDLFGKLAFKNSVFLTSRTLVLLPKDFILRLYNAVHEAGFEYIVGFEQHGLSMETLQPYVFDCSDKDSVIWRDKMYIHNYLGLLESSGYKVENAYNFATGHASPDYKIMSFVAKRV